VRGEPFRTLVARRLKLRSLLPYCVRIKITGTTAEMAGRYTSARSMVPSRIGTATLAVLATVHGPEPDRAVPARRQYILWH
jgi:hypothetical protein